MAWPRSRTLGIYVLLLPVGACCKLSVSFPTTDLSVISVCWVTRPQPEDRLTLSLEMLHIHPFLVFGPLSQVSAFPVPWYNGME